MRLWRRFGKFVIEKQNSIPVEAYPALAALSDDEFTVANIERLSSTLKSLPLHETVTKGVAIESIKKHRFLISQSFWLLLFAYQAIIGRAVYLIIAGVQRNSLIYWKNDSHHQSLLRSVLSPEEIKSVYDLKISAFDFLINLLQGKILIEINKVLIGEAVTEDNIKVAKKYASLLQNK